jgi:outer membrane protein TolC
MKPNFWRFLMSGRIARLLAVLVLLWPAVSWTQERTEQVFSLTLEDAILRTLKNNYGVAIQILSPEIAAYAVSQAREKFLPTLGFGFSDRSNEAASYSWLEQVGRTISDYYDYDASVSQLVPTGGTLTASWISYKNTSNSKFQTVNPRYGSTLRFDFRQPLLRDFGIKITRNEILISQNAYEKSGTDLEKTIADVIYAVEEAYWNLVYSQENLKVMQQSLKLAQDLLAKNQRAVEVGTLAPIEILSAQAEVATREADILSAEAEVKNNEDRLRTIVNLPEEEMRLALPIQPVDTPKFQERQVNVDEALLTAMQNRPELKSLKIDLNTQDLNLGFAKNQLLPRLDLQASYYSPGVSGDLIVYKDDNPLTGEILYKIPGSSKDAVKDSFNFKYNNWAVGLTLDIPLNTIFSRASVAQAKLNLEQAMLRLKNQEQIIYLEIRNGVRSVEMNYKRVQSYRVARELAEKKLLAEEEKLKVGLSTNFIVLTYQRDLSNARIAELRSIVDYVISEASLEKATGTNLKNKNISVDQFMGRQ